MSSTAASADPAAPLGVRNILHTGRAEIPCGDHGRFVRPVGPGRGTAPHPAGAGAGNRTSACRSRSRADARRRLHRRRVGPPLRRGGPRHGAGPGRPSRRRHRKRLPDLGRRAGVPASPATNSTSPLAPIRNGLQIRLSGMGWDGRRCPGDDGAATESDGAAGGRPARHEPDHPQQATTPQAASGAGGGRPRRAGRAARSPTICGTR